MRGRRVDGDEKSSTVVFKSVLSEYSSGLVMPQRGWESQSDDEGKVLMIHSPEAVMGVDEDKQYLISKQLPTSSCSNQLESQARAEFDPEVLRKVKIEDDSIEGAFAHLETSDSDSSQKPGVTSKTEENARNDEKESKDGLTDEVGGDEQMQGQDDQSQSEEAKEESGNVCVLTCQACRKEIVSDAMQCAGCHIAKYCS